MNKFIITSLHQYIKENLNFEDREYLLSKSEKISNSGMYLNCQSFSQELLDYTDKKSLKMLDVNIFDNGNNIENIEVLKVGDLLEFNNISHYAIYIGDNEALEVEQWGAKPRVISLNDLLKDYEGTTAIYRK